MGFALKMYKNTLIVKYEKDGIIPYLSYKDFKDLKYYESNFKNSIGLNIKYFIYHYDNFKTDKYILFCHGMGPGHTAYLREIEHLARNGYLVLTLDYTGCDKSEGETLISVNEPTRDVHDLLMYVKSGVNPILSTLKEMEVIVVGHSLGAYTALNTINIHNDIKKAVVISGFTSIIDEFKAISHIPFGFIFNDIKRFEKNALKDYYDISNKEYLKKTKDNILFIHSKDDAVVPIKASPIKYIKNKPNIEVIITDGKGHNPNYTVDAVKYMREVFGNYASLVKDGTLKTIVDKKDFMKDKDIFKMTEQDEEIYQKIFSFIEK